MQALNISNLHDHNLQVITTNKPEMKHFSIFSTNNTLTKLRSFPITHYSSHVVKIIPTILTPITVVIILILIIIL